MTVSALSESTQFPRTDVTGQHQHTTASLGSPCVILKAVIFDEIGNVFARDLWELRELPQESTKIGKDTFDNSATLCTVEVGHRKLQVSIADASQPPVNLVD